MREIASTRATPDFDRLPMRGTIPSVLTTVWTLYILRGFGRRLHKYDMDCPWRVHFASSWQESITSTDPFYESTLVATRIRA
ncbi:hypothetical protein ASPZODRAFT_309406 [Penicilliopsis zonata CBS 506.65]|uniref:Uncharacterized protein n=1 Tax=Penicilliopsis zonata CBS 506.65 TaxID=1073090 RepID=A0A1L9SV05_9EURO|nr:hypothetical protein ASPZODRAFT_309406 [Penicilliopsis zonata CBS 506.65]OJJ51029.1 hypothetical protein ASPZODRAFT_309406 [Penicilliopsis zonata CBS 506.65]